MGSGWSGSGSVGVQCVVRVGMVVDDAGVGRGASGASGMDVGLGGGAVSLLHEARGFGWLGFGCRGARFSVLCSVLLFVCSRFVFLLAGFLVGF